MYNTYVHTHIHIHIKTASICPQTHTHTRKHTHVLVHTQEKAKWKCEDETTQTSSTTLTEQAPAAAQTESPHTESPMSPCISPSAEQGGEAGSCLKEEAAGSCLQEPRPSASAREPTVEANEEKEDQQGHWERDADGKRAWVSVSTSSAHQVATGGAKDVPAPASLDERVRVSAMHTSATLIKTIVEPRQAMTCMYPPPHECILLMHASSSS